MHVALFATTKSPSFGPVSIHSMLHLAVSIWRLCSVLGEVHFEMHVNIKDATQTFLMSISRASSVSTLMFIVHLEHVSELAREGFSELIVSQKFYI